MKRLIYSALCSVMILLLAACGRSDVPEDALPTRVPTLAAEIFTAPASTATAIPAEPTATPEVVAPSAEVTGTEEITSTEVAPSTEVTETEEISETADITSTDTVTASAEVTASEEMTDSATVTATQELTATDSLTDTTAVTSTEEISATDEVTGTEAEAIPLLTANDEMTETAEITDTTEITATGATTTTGAATDIAAEETEADQAGEADTGIDPALAGLPAEILAAMEQADPVRGQQLSLTNACSACHSTDPGVTMVGPTWRNVATTAESRIEGMSSGLYLYESIVDPNAYVVENYPAGVMLQIYANLPAQDLADLVSYLLTLKEQP